MQYIKKGKKFYQIGNEINKSVEVENIKQALNRLNDERKNKVSEINNFFDARKENLENKLSQLNKLT